MPGHEKRQEYHDKMYTELDEINRLYIRPIQKALYLCSATCCDIDRPQAEVNRCLENCAAPLAKTQDFISAEFGSFQNRLQRCITDCNDSAKDRLGLNPTDVQVDLESRAFENCANACLNQHLELLPNFTRRMHQILKEKIKEE